MINNYINDIIMRIFIDILTIVGTLASLYSWYKTWKYKNEVLEKLDYVDFSAFLDRFYSVVQDLSKTKDSETNQKGGKLDKILDDISGLMTETLKMLKNLSDDDKLKIKERSNEVKIYIMKNRIRDRIDVVFLRVELDNIYEIFNNSLNNQKVKKI